MDGILNIYKEKGYTSHDVVARLRGILKQKKIGHTGTLDPDAEGVLPVCLGKSTKVCDLLTNKDKTYETVLLLGTVTDTQDVTGHILEQKETGILTEDSVHEAVMSFQGDYDQIPPMYSALKVGGKKLYELARAGVEVERKSRKVTVHAINILAIDLPRVKMEVVCSKGTYIRTLCHDIGRQLNVGGCMEALTRTSVSEFQIIDSLRLDEIEQKVKEGTLNEYVHATSDMFPDAPIVIIDQKFEKAAYNGNALSYSFFSDAQWPDRDSRVRVFDEAGHFIGLYTYEAEAQNCKPVKMFLEGIR